MEMIACQCDDLPAHDHYMGQAPDGNGVWGPVWDMDDIGRVWVPWKTVAKTFSEMLFWNGL